MHHNNGLHRFRTLLAVMIATCGAAATVGITTLAAMGRDIPPILAAMAGGALGSLATALTRFPPPTEEEKQ